MKCPKCKTDMEEFRTEGVTFDFCFSGCKGIWCDAGELAQYVETIKDLPPVDPSLVKETPLECGKCSGAMLERPYQEGGTLVDVCVSCKGIWLDFKELGSIQKESLNVDLKGRLDRVLFELNKKGYEAGVVQVSGKKLKSVS